MTTTIRNFVYSEDFPPYVEAPEPGYVQLPRYKKGILQDGERMRTPMFMMDSLSRAGSGASASNVPPSSQHRPGPIAIGVDPQSRADLYRERDAAYEAAYLNPPDPHAQVVPRQNKLNVPGNDRKAAYAARDDWYQNAWKATR